MNRSLCLTGVVFAFLAQAASAYTISATNATAQCGAVVPVAITIDDALLMQSFQFELYYDPTLVTPLAVTATEMTAGWTITMNSAADHITVAGSSPQPILGGSGSMVTVSFSAGSAANGPSPIDLRNALVNETPATASDGTLTLTCTSTGLRGDANGDNSVTAPDVFYLVNFLFANGLAPVGNGDANSSGTVDVTDVFYLINYLFAGGPAPAA